MTFRVIIPARIRRTDTTNERFSERINREWLSVFTARSSASVLRSSLSLPDAQKAEPSTRGYLRDRLLYRHNPRGAYPGFLCLCIWSPLIFSLSLTTIHPPLPSVERRTTTTRTYTRVKFDRNLLLHARVLAFDPGDPTRRRKARIKATMSAVSGLSSHSRYGDYMHGWNIARSYPFQRLRRCRTSRFSSSNLSNAMIVFVMYIWDNDIRICNSITWELTEYFGDNPRILKLHLRSRYNLRNCR